MSVLSGYTGALHGTSQSESRRRRPWWSVRVLARAELRGRVVDLAQAQPGRQGGLRRGLRSQIADHQGTERRSRADARRLASVRVERPQVAAGGWPAGRVQLSANDGRRVIYGRAALRL